MKTARITGLAWTLVAALVVGGLAGQDLLLAQEKAPALATAPAGGVPANLLTAEPPFPVRVYTKAESPATPRLEDLPLQGSVYRYGVTWTFEKPARVGRFVNGDWYVVGPVTVTQISPKPLLGDEVTDPTDREKLRFKGKYCRNGSVLNVPVTPYVSGFDSRVPHDRYKPDMTARLPIAMKPGDAFAYGDLAAAPWWVW
jgi:hypothetical protein